MQAEVKKLQEWIDNSKNIVFFGGAGVSTASGIPDFRSPNGLYSQQTNHKYSPEFMLSHTFYQDHTKEFFEFYKTEMCALGYEPCETHKKIAELEKAGKVRAVVTQNIDGLHQLAGSEKVIELHGTIHKNKCIICEKEFNAEFVKNSKGIPTCTKCKCSEAIVKPCVTLYEEMLPDGAFESAEDAIKRADLLIIAGTSLNVYPAASLIDYFDKSQGHVVLINKGNVGRNPYADLVFDTDMNEVFEQIKVNK